MTTISNAYVGNMDVGGRVCVGVVGKVHHIPLTADQSPYKFLRHYICPLDIMCISACTQT